MKVIAEGMDMGHIRYGIAVYLAGEMRTSDEEPLNKGMSLRQTKQNEMMRVVLNKTRRDQTPRHQLLEQFGTK